VTVWSRIFGRSTQPPSLATLLESLAGRPVTPHFRGDDLGWTGGELHLPSGSPILLERYLTIEDDLRDDLNAYAAELETLDYSPNNALLMERVIQSSQLITIRKPADSPDELLAEAIVEACCRALAVATDGVYQRDRLGWYDANGTLLLEEY
jgi:hypothetical protein